MKVLVSAYACRPGAGSDLGVGWNLVTQVARFHQIWVLAEARHRSAIEQALESYPMPNVRWVFLGLPRPARWWWGLRRRSHVYYYLWQVRAWFAANRLHKEIHFDLVHHVTLVRYWMPSFLPFLNVPFVWGPVGGGESAPQAFRSVLSLEGRLFELSRDLGRWLGEHDPLGRAAARRSAWAGATTAESARHIRRMGAPRVVVMPAIALSPADLNQLGSTSVANRRPVRFLSIGRLLPWKGFQLGLEALAVTNLRDVEYRIIGDGPERERLEALAVRLGLGGRVTFLGRLPRSEVMHKLSESDVLVHPSLHDSGGLVCLEAMAAGRPVICLDLGGPGLLVTEESGIKVPAISPDQAVKGLAEAMTRIARDSALRRRIGGAARERVVEIYTWEKKGRELADLYREVASQAASSSPVGKSGKDQVAAAL